MDIIGATEVHSIPVPEYEYITTEVRAKEILAYLDQFNVLEVDTEGTALDPYKCRTTLVQIGIPGFAYVFDIRNDTAYSDIHGSIFKDLFEDKSKLKILQNANYDLKVIKAQFGYYIENIYDTMLAEQLLNLGIKMRGFALNNLVDKYLHMKMDKEPRGTFEDYYQEFTSYQLDYAAKDVVVLDLIRNMQMEQIKFHGLEETLQLEMDFTKPLAEMELNGITIDVDKWRIIMDEVGVEAVSLRAAIEKALSETQEQTALFGVSTINIDSPKQLLKSLNKLEIKLENTNVESLKKFVGHPMIDDLLKYRGFNKLITTYSESLIDSINNKTGRLHTSFKQMVQTGRLSSSKPNMQNIPGKQRYRSPFIAPPGYCLITVDQASAELLIMGNMSGEPNFKEAFENGLDLHTLNASRIYSVPYEKVTKVQRTASKAISFGLAYGISAVGLARDLGITKKAASELMDKYYAANSVLKKWLDDNSRKAIKDGYSTTIIGRKRFYSIPPIGDPDREKVSGAVSRQAKNAPIQGSDADTIKKAMILCMDRLAASVYKETAKLILTVHDEIIVECKNEDRYEVSKIVVESVEDGFNQYFPDMPMKTDPVFGPTWLKGECEKDEQGNDCGGNEMKLVPDDHYGTKLLCCKCGKFQG